MIFHLIMDICVHCSLIVLYSHKGIACDSCNRWCHLECDTNMSEVRYQQLQSESISIDWYCRECLNRENLRTTDQYGHFSGDIPEVPCPLLIPVPENPVQEISGEISWTLHEEGNINSGVSFI